MSYNFSKNIYSYTVKILYKIRIKYSLPDDSKYNDVMDFE